MKKRLITGGCGFIGSNFIRYVTDEYPDDFIVNIDALTYAGKKENLTGINDTNYKFVQGNICDQRLVRKLFEKYDFDEVVNFAAESHVDNSIAGPRIFIETNVNGTLNLLDIALAAWKKKDGTVDRTKKFLQISTDEVYGSITDGSYKETSVLHASSPYSASKAAADLLVQAYGITYGMPFMITRCTNNYGPFQGREKFLPLMITQALCGKPLPVYGDGGNVRDWLHVLDHCVAIELVLRKGTIGEIYNIGADNEWKNIDVVTTLLEKMGKPKTLINFVTDRLGHDRRYSLDSSKIRSRLGWQPTISFEDGLAETIAWYRNVL
ncbi:MAG: dTDP-glucose 4,6-dehydratase [Candidatus Omnitrophica bacterium]|nr:dTDP-glucose 4,6-dehydratase [Candidatus Omnitrophota bacterium]